MKNVLETQHDVLIHLSHKLSIRTFTCNKRSIFKKFERLANQQIIIGGYLDNSIPTEVFQNIIESLPTKTEIEHYVNSRITDVLSQYLEGVKDSGKLFEKYLERRNKIVHTNSISSIKAYESEKYAFILSKLKTMLENSDVIPEKNWQNEILEIILLLFPKYIQCFDNVQIKDYYSKSSPTNRFIDLMLIDSSGNIDVIEIKKPSYNIISNKTYRDNYTPLKELSGAIMQVEKYLFHLNKWGVNGEKDLTKKLKEKIPQDLRIKITNPKGIVIMGRDDQLSNDQEFDFEIIKRKYSNIVDVITYDDLIRRLEALINNFQT